MAFPTKREKEFKRRIERAVALIRDVRLPEPGQHDGSTDPDVAGQLMLVLDVLMGKSP